MDFSERLREIRVRSGLTQEEVARRLRVTPMSVWGWEKGRRRPSIDQVEEIAAALGVAPAELFMTEHESAAVRAAMMILAQARTELAATGTDGAKRGQDALHPTITKWPNNEGLVADSGTYGPEDPEALGHYQRLYAGAIA